MPSAIGYVDNTGGTLAHYNMLQQIRDFAAANGWTILRYNTVPANRELIMKAPGLSGEEDIYVGFRTYQDASADYYNLVAAAFTGYLSSNTFDAQPGAMLSGVPCHNNRVDYWLTLNGQRLALAMKVGTPVYESVYLGKFLPYAMPDQYPYPVIVAGMLNGIPATRFSDTVHSMPYKGTRPNMRMRFNSGAWLQPDCSPWIGGVITGDTTQARDTGGIYALTPVVMSDGNGIYGELDGVFHISGFNNAVENTLVIGGVTYVVIQDVGRNGFSDYYALRMD
ncbi:hypothetical protein [Pseudomonas pseudonitroreducens]|uniref:hypothetical protein n=1 Tax=Pseudomonas pseudonitroreducens TaxID=2892326 RepID=UPI001F17F6A7|nr:hypothetical protein [Pseudomonas pseudonitroreducens]